MKHRQRARSCRRKIINRQRYKAMRNHQSTELQSYANASIDRATNQCKIINRQSYKPMQNHRSKKLQTNEKLSCKARNRGRNKAQCFGTAANLGTHILSDVGDRPCLKGYFSDVYHCILSHLGPFVTHII